MIFFFAKSEEKAKGIAERINRNDSDHLQKLDLKLLRSKKREKNRSSIRGNKRSRSSSTLTVGTLNTQGNPGRSRSIAQKVKRNIPRERCRHHGSHRDQEKTYFFMEKEMQNERNTWSDSIDT